VPRLGAAVSRRAATCFHAVNRAKAGITIDLADRDDAARLRALILERADVVIHNLKAGALDRYGLGASELDRREPALVCCNLGAFGATGPLRDKPGYDPMMQAYSGLMSLLGEDGRRRSGAGIDRRHGRRDVVGDRHPRRVAGARPTGKGGIVETSLYETGLAWMSIYLAGFLSEPRDPGAARVGGRHDRALPRPSPR